MLYLSRDASAQVLVDPSCSGSGMRHEHSSVIEESNVRELVELQTSVLKHALLFPQALRVVYRCSMFQPNEAMQWPLMLVYLQHLLSLRGRERRRRRGGRDYAAQTFLSCAFTWYRCFTYVTRPKTFNLTGPILGRLRRMVASDCSSRLASTWYRAIHVGQQVRAC